MSWRDLFRTPPPAPPPSVQRAAVPVPVARPPAYHAVPATTGNPVDAEVVRLWLAYSAGNRSATWAGFLDSLVAANTKLAQEVAIHQADLADIAKRGVLRR